MDEWTERPTETEGWLKILLTAGDYAAMAPILEALGRAAPGQRQLWRYRRYYRALPEALVAQSPGLWGVMALVAALGGEVSGEAAARLHRRLDTLPPGCEPSLEQDLCTLEAVLPGRRPGSALGRLAALVGQRGRGEGLTLSLTANRPSVICGSRDYTAYGTYLLGRQALLGQLCQTLFGTRGPGVAACAEAELLYQRDQVYDALVVLMRAIPDLERQGDQDLLFAARALELSMMAAGGQVTSGKGALETLRRRLSQADGVHLLPNLSALEARSAMYDGDYSRVMSWMEEEAPDERGEFCVLDCFAYFVKLRGYLIQGRHLALVGLVERLRPVLADFGRIRERCELDMLAALSHHAQGDGETALGLMAGVLARAERHRYDRLLADEGERLYFLLREYGAARGESPYLARVRELCRKMTLLYPNYLKARGADLVPLTESELAVLRLMAAERTNGEIARFMQVSVNTVKFHSKNIYLKLNAASRLQAVRIGKEVGIL